MPSRTQVIERLRALGRLAQMINVSPTLSAAATEAADLLTHAEPRADILDAAIDEYLEDRAQGGRDNESILLRGQSDALKAKREAARR